MTTYYRNNETGLIQKHPVSGIGESLNSVEVGEDAKPIIPLGASDDEVKRLTKLAGGSKPRRGRGNKTSGAPSTGEQEGAN